jgi:hypothetical protein
MPILDDLRDAFPAANDDQIRRMGQAIAKSDGIPARIGEALCKHKYLNKVPTGNASNPWRYVYKPAAQDPPETPHETAVDDEAKRLIATLDHGVPSDAFEYGHGVYVKPKSEFQHTGKHWNDLVQRLKQYEIQFTPEDDGRLLLWHPRPHDRRHTA